MFDGPIINNQQKWLICHLYPQLKTCQCQWYPQIKMFIGQISNNQQKW